MESKDKKMVVYNNLLSNISYEEMPKEVEDKFNDTIDDIIKLPYKDILCHYCFDDEYIEYNLYFNNGIEASIAYYGKDEDCSFSIYMDDEPLVINEIDSINEFVNKFLTYVLIIHNIYK